ncbi:MAG: PASTA domain-containing protein, partial [Chitinophagaceae bacterium]
INRAVPPMVDMPNLVSTSSRSAQMSLENANLKLGKIDYKTSFDNDAVLEQLYNGEKIAPGTKIRMGATISLVVSKGMGEEQILVPSLYGMTYCDGRSFLKERGLEFGSVVPTGEISDTCNAYIIKQTPDKYDEDGKFRYIRSGQLMDIWIQQDKPNVDSLTHPAAPPAEN